MALVENDFRDELVAQMESISTEFNALSQENKDLFKNGLATALARTTLLFIKGGVGESKTLSGVTNTISGTDSNGDTPGTLAVVTT